MSIINQTLRELDARRPTPAAPPAPSAAVPTRRRPGLWALAVVLLPIAGAAAWIAWSTLGAMSPRTAPAQPALAPAMPAPPPVSVATAPVDTPAVNPSPAPQRPPHRPAPVVGGSAATAPSRALPETGNPLDVTPAQTLPVLPAAQPVPPPIQHETRPPSGREIADTHYRKALAELQAGRSDGARIAFRAALDAAPAHPEARLALAALLSRSGQTAEAETLLRDGRVLAPDHPGLAMSLARLQAARGDTPGAAATLLETVASPGAGADHHATLAALLVQLDRPAEAARHYEQALRQQPGQGTSWAGLAMSLEAQGKPDQARTAYQRALQTGNLPDDLAAFARAKVGK